MTSYVSKELTSHELNFSVVKFIPCIVRLLNKIQSIASGIYILGYFLRYNKKEHNQHKAEWSAVGLPRSMFVKAEGKMKPAMT